jgi:succinoglycan biosynthesis transport protein ExoP
VSVNEALRVVRRRWRIVALCVLLGLLGAGVASYLTPREYSSDVTLYVSLQGRADSSDAAYQASQIAKERVVSYAPLLQDERITQPVIDKLQLGVTAAQLAQRITVTVQPDTVVLSAAVTDTSPQRAADIANALADEFVGLVSSLEQPFGPQPAAAPAGQPAPQATKIGVQIIRPATAVNQPISPNIPFNIALGTALGLLVGLAAAFLRNARDTRIHSAERLRELTGAPLLAEIPTERNARMYPLTLGAPPGSARVEAMRKLRTNLQFPHGGRPSRVVVVTSATVGEGKTTTACNLALALADAGARVLIVDLNLRRPDVHHYLQVEPGAGVANVLVGRIAAARATVRWVDGGVDVLPAGPVPANPSELVASRAMGALLDEVRHRYDFVILDTPAILPVTDAAAVAARADGTVLVVRYDRTAEEQVADAVGGLEAVGAPLLGVVLTGTPGTRLIHRDRSGSYPEPDPASIARRPPSAPAAQQAGQLPPPAVAQQVVPAPPTAPVAQQRPQQPAQPQPATADGAEESADGAAAAQNGKKGQNGQKATASTSASVDQPTEMLTGSGVERPAAPSPTRRS